MTAAPAHHVKRATAVHSAECRSSHKINIRSPLLCDMSYTTLWQPCGTQRACQPRGSGTDWSRPGSFLTQEGVLHGCMHVSACACLCGEPQLKRHNVGRYRSFWTHNCIHMLPIPNRTGLSLVPLPGARVETDFRGSSRPLPGRRLLAQVVGSTGDVKHFEVRGELVNAVSGLT